MIYHMSGPCGESESGDIMNVTYVHTDGTTSSFEGIDTSVTPSGKDLKISVQKNLVKSGGWLARVNSHCAAFTTASAAKNWCVEIYNEETDDSRKRLPWVKISEYEFTANAKISSRGKISFEK